jgi:hypothetical protein
MDAIPVGEDGRFILGRRLQLAYLVKDMDKALETWTEKLKVGPFVVFEHALGNRQFIHRGERSPVDFALALSYVGETQIELICPWNDAPSIYSEAMPQGADGACAHHIAFWPEDMEAARRDLIEQGFEERASIRSQTGDVDVYYFSSPASLGVMLEIAPMNSARRVYFSKIKALCERPTADEKILRFRDKDEFMASIAAGGG